LSTQRRFQLVLCIFPGCFQGIPGLFYSTNISMSLFVENSISINAAISKVWDALTKPEWTKQYMFGCETVCDWKYGSELLWKGEYEGKEMVFVKGHIVTIEPGNLLVYTTIDPHSTIDDISENYLHVTYRLTEENGQTLFTVTQGDYSTVAEGERRYKEAYNNGEGWNPILVQIKRLVENG
jgi:uncharacterized protein YndB with AHSA1/START domain